MNYEYPYTDFHEINLDYILKLARESLGLNLVVEGNKLLLKNNLGETISNVTIHYADTALNDVDGKPIKSYIFSAGTENNSVIFTKGDGTTTMITVPYATKATNDDTGRNITQYIVNVNPSEKRLNFTRGDGTTLSFEVPFAQTALGDKNSKDITTYVASISTNGDELVITDGNGIVLSQFKVTYAEKAKNDVDGDAIKSYAKVLQTGERTVKLLSKEGNVLSEITVPFATMAMEDTNGRSLLEDYGATLDVINNDIALKSFSGKTLSTITVPFATVSTDATNAIERVDVSGNNIAFTTFGGTRYEITSPYSLKATSDESGNKITKNYVAAVEKDSTTGDFVFKAKDGTEIARLVSESETAKNDTFGNLIANYIKTIVVSDESNYVTVTHGDGTVDTLTINYAQQAWKDTYGNIIGNFYIGFLKCINDENTGDPVVVAYNGENAELFRFSVKANSAKYDDNGNNIYTSYASSLTYSDNTLKLLAKSGDELSSITIEIPEPITGYGKSLSLDGQTLTLKDETNIDLSSVELPKPPEPYTLPTASADTLGGIKVGNNLAISEDGVLNAPTPTPAITNYGKSLSLDGQTLTLKDETNTDLSSVELPKPAEPYTLPTASANTLGGIKVGNNLAISEDGTLSASASPEPYTLPIASANTLGGIKVGNNLAISEDGTLSASVSPEPYTLPVASSEVLGGIKVGDNLTITSDGKLSAPTPTEPYTLPTASADTLGGIKVGNNLTIDSDGVLNAPAPTPAITNYGKSLSISDNTLSLKDETDTILNSVDLPIPDAYTLPKASGTTLGGIKVGNTLQISSNGILNKNDNFFISLNYDSSTCSYSIKSVDDKPIYKLAETTFRVRVFKDNAIIFITDGNVVYINNQYYVIANLNLSEIDSPGSSLNSNINGTIVMSVDSGSASIIGSYVYNNTIAFNTFDNASALTKVIKLYKGFTSNTSLLYLFRYNYFNININPEDVEHFYTLIKPFQIDCQDDFNMVYFYYIYQDAINARYLIRDSYNISTETYTYKDQSTKIFA